MQAVGAHRDAQVLLARLNPTERDDLVPILRTVLGAVLGAPETGIEFPALMDQQAPSNASAPH